MPLGTTPLLDWAGFLWPLALALAALLVGALGAVLTLQIWPRTSSN